MVELVHSGLDLILTPALCYSDWHRALVSSHAVRVRMLSRSLSIALNAATEAAWNGGSHPTVTKLRDVLCPWWAAVYSKLSQAFL